MVLENKTEQKNNLHPEASDVSNSIQLGCLFGFLLKHGNKYIEG